MRWEHVPSRISLYKRHAQSVSLWRDRLGMAGYALNERKGCSNSMKKRQRGSRAIRHIGVLRAQAAAKADDRDPAQRDGSASPLRPRLTTSDPCLIDGNRNETFPASPNNRWGSVRQM